MAGISEVFNLDFKFGGNSEFLSRLETLMERIDARFDSVSDGIEETSDATKEMADNVDDLSDSFKRGLGTLEEFADRLKDVAKYYLSFQAVQSGLERAWSFGMEGMDAYSTQERAENQLKGVLKNRGSLDQFQNIKDYAATIQGRTIYGDEAMIKGAGELATYVKGTGSLRSMMDLLTDYAAGMTGGGEVSPEQMESLATGLGMAYDGNYMAMRRKGFDTSKLEALDAIVENGGQWGAKDRKKYGDVLDGGLLAEIRKNGGVTEQMRVDALKESLSDWQGLANTVNGLDSSALIRFNNALGDMKENLGKKVYPVFNRLVGTLNANMPRIDAMFSRVGDIFMSMADTLDNNLDSLFEIGEDLATILPAMAELGLNLVTLAQKVVGLKEAVIALAGAMAVGKVIEFKGSIVSLFATVRKEMAATSAQMSGMAKIRGGLNKAMAGSVAQMVLMAGALWGIQKIAEFIIAAKKAYDTGKFEEFASGQDTMADQATDKIIAARKKRKQYQDDADAIMAKYKDRDFDESDEQSMKDYRRLQKYNALVQKMDRRIAKYSAEQKGYKNSAANWRSMMGDGVNPMDQAMAEAEKASKELMKQEKGSIYQQFNNTNIEQNVNLAADIQKVGILLNQNIRALLETQLRKNREVSIVNRD